MKRVHFICRGNVFRSRMAEAYFRSKGYEAISSGTAAIAHAEHNLLLEPRVQHLLERKGLGAYVRPHWVQLTQDRIDEDDIVVYMNRAVRDEAETLVKLPSDERVWDIIDLDEVDPVPTTDEELDRFLEEMYQKIAAKVDRFVAEDTELR